MMKHPVFNFVPLAGSAGSATREVEAGNIRQALKAYFHNRERLLLLSPASAIRSNS